MKNKLFCTIIWLVLMTYIMPLVSIAAASENSSTLEKLFCSECGEQIPVGSKFCMYCAHPVVISSCPAASDTLQIIEKDQLPLNDGTDFILGSFEQDAVYNGEEPIEWQVLDRIGKKILLISKYGLEFSPFCEEATADPDWETSSLRSLENKFFLQEEIEAILPPFFAEENHSEQSADKESVDRVFLLTIDQVERYFPSNESRCCKATEYAEANNPSQRAGKNCAWWLRTPGNKPGRVNVVSDDGKIIEVSAETKTIAFRPAIWIDLESDSWKALEKKNEEWNHHFAEIIQKMDLQEVAELRNNGKKSERIPSGPIIFTRPAKTEDQLQLIFQNSKQWQIESGTSMVMYAVTDLDNNGRIEIISSDISSATTQLRVYEVNEMYNALNELGSGVRSNYMLSYGDVPYFEVLGTPDLVPEEYIFGGRGDPVTKINAFYLSPQGRIYYAVHNTAGSMESGEEIQECMYLENGEMHVFPVAWRYRDQFWRSTYFDDQGNSIGREDFVNWNSVFENYNYQPIQILWFPFCSLQAMRDSYEAFAG